jgi:hypothetical protein
MAEPRTKKVETINAPLPTEASAKPTPLEEAINETLKNRTAEVRVREYEFAFQQRRADMYAASGMFTAKDMTREMAVSQAMVRIDLGEAMGFTPAESLMGISVIANRPCIESSLRAARMEANGYKWDITWHWAGKPETSECVGITLHLSHDGEPLFDNEGNPVTVSYLKADAERMLTTMWDDATKSKRRVSILEKDNWKMTPRNMYFARAITNAQRWYAPGVLSANLLSREEAEDEPSETVQSAQTEPRPSARADALRNKVREKASTSASAPLNEEPKQEAKSDPPAERENAEIPWIDREDMDEAFRAAKAEMNAKFGSHGVAEFERVWKNACPIKTLQEGANAYRHLRSVMVTMYQLHGQSQEK